MIWLVFSAVLEQITYKIVVVNPRTSRWCDKISLETVIHFCFDISLYIAFLSLGHHHSVVRLSIHTPTTTSSPVLTPTLLTPPTLTTFHRQERNWDQAVQMRGRSFARNLETYKMLTRLRPPKVIEGGKVRLGELGNTQWLDPRCKVPLGCVWFVMVLEFSCGWWWGCLCDHFSRVLLKWVCHETEEKR